ncbi:MAG: B12-binding domain-containing radical SAM protein [Planctomycetaceae bacterium]
MRVLFVYPNIDCPPGINHGLAAMSGVLKSRGHAVDLVHVCDNLWELPTTGQVLDRIDAFRPDIVGFSVMSQQFPWSCGISRALRARHPALPQAVGGVHCTMVPEEVVACALFDYVFLGECDLAFAELVDRMRDGGDLASVPNSRIPARFSPTGVEIRNAVGPFPDLAALPETDYDLFDIEHIVERKNGWMGLITSRGCPYKCTYCFNKEIVDLYKEEGGATTVKEYLRAYPVERMIEEIAALKRRHPGIKTLIIDDDLFTLNKPYVHRWTQAYRESGIGLPFVVNAHVQCFDDTMAKALADAGCRIVKYGLESGSDRVRKEVLWRFMTNRQIAETTAAAHRHGLHTSAFIMFGLPHESREEIFETLRLCAEVKMGRFRWAIFFPFPGTAGYTIAKEAALIDWSRWENMGNYFDASCLKFGEAHDLFLEKLGALCPWYVNALTDWPSAKTYTELVREVEAMDRETFRRRRTELIAYDRELSEQLLRLDLPHYSLRYAHVMGVRSDFVRWERRLEQSSREEQAVVYTLD